MFPTWKKQPVFFILYASLSVTLIIFVGMLTLKNYAEWKEVGHQPSGRDTITLEGEGKISGKPDLAEVSIGLTTEGEDVPSVQDANTHKVNEMIQSLKQAGVAAADIQTSHYSINPRYQYDAGKQTVIGYTVSQNLTVKVRELTHLGDILQRVGQLGANHVNGVQFVIDDPSSLKQAARKLALKDAEAKAQELADALHVKLVRVVTFSEVGRGSPTPYPYAVEAVGLGGSKSAAPTMEPGSLDVASNISVTFEIR